MEINKLLKKLRIENEFSQSDIAKRLGISEGKVGHHETGRTPVTIETLNKYAEIYNVPVGYFYKEEEKQNYVDDLLKRLLDEKIITDVDNIPDRVVNMIMNAVKLEIQMNLINDKK